MMEDPTQEVSPASSPPLSSPSSSQSSSAMLEQPLTDEEEEHSAEEAWFATGHQLKHEHAFEIKNES